ncbi:MAG: hypothetical protein ACM3XM_05615 [Mycobacterium leprae]
MAPEFISPEYDLHVQAMVAWHFDPATGSPYWLRRAATLGFDPLTEIRGLADLCRFPAVADEWRSVPAADLIPRGCPGPFDVWESGGTTGAPRRVVDSRHRARGREHLSHVLDQFGFPPVRPWIRALHDDRQVGGWLLIGPSGPHLVGTNVGRLARERGALRYAVDLDPRWVKRLYREGRLQEARSYIAHVVEQALTVLRTQPVEVLAVTPPLLEALCANPEAYDLLQQKLKGVIWFGTSMTDESLRLMEEELLPGVPMVGWYGNTLAGIACQRPRTAADPFRCIFHLPGPGSIARVVEPGNPATRVGYGEEGQICIHVLHEEMFLPWHLERDRAVRVKPEGSLVGDDVAHVAPFTGSGAAVEGVY